MSLSVIGSGFGRTGTKSLKEALEQLGFGPCHHMHENVEHPELVPHWQAVAAGKPVDWNAVFAGYKSQVDWPGAHVWRELSAAFPDSKVVHTVRPADAWWNSFSKTIGKLGQTYTQIPLPPHIKDMLDAGFEMIQTQTFGGKMADRDNAIAAFNLRQRSPRRHSGEPTSGVRRVRRLGTAVQVPQCSGTGGSIPAPQSQGGFLGRARRRARLRKRRPAA